MSNRPIRLVAAAAAVAAAASLGLGACGFDEVVDVAAGPTTTEASRTEVLIGRLRFAVPAGLSGHQLDGYRTCITDADSDPEILEFFCPGVLVAADDGADPDADPFGWSEQGSTPLCDMDGVHRVTESTPAGRDAVTIDGTASTRRRWTLTCDDGTSSTVTQWQLSAVDLVVTNRAGAEGDDLVEHHLRIR